MSDFEGWVREDAKLEREAEKAMTDLERAASSERYDWAEDPTAQDVIDAMRIAVMAQDDPAKAMPVVKTLLDFAPEMESSRGIDLLLRLISEATLKVEMVDRDSA